VHLQCSPSSAESSQSSNIIYLDLSTRALKIHLACTAEELTDEAALTRVRRVLLDVDAVPYVLQLFASQNPLRSGGCYSTTFLLKTSSITLPLLAENLLQGHTKVYRS
jgi:hypothetical protein